MDGIWKIATSWSSHCTFTLEHFPVPDARASWSLRAMGVAKRLSVSVAGVAAGCALLSASQRASRALLEATQAFFIHDFGTEQLCKHFICNLRRWFRHFEFTSSVRSLGIPFSSRLYHFQNIIFPGWLKIKIFTQSIHLKWTAKFTIIFEDDVDSTPFQSHLFYFFFWYPYSYCEVFPGLELLSDFDKTQDTGPRCWLRPAATTPSLATAGRRLVNEFVASQWF